MCPALKAFGHTTAFEIDQHARAECLEGGKCDAVFPSGEFADLVSKYEGQFSLVSLLDVIEHVEDDVKFLKDIGRLMPPGGHLLVFVPAHMSMWSELDVLAKHYRRYNKAGVISVLERAGYDVEFCSYWNMLLLIPAYLLRRGSGRGGYFAFSLPRWLDRLIFAWVWFETWMMSYVGLPFGITVVVYARKRGDVAR